MKGTKVVMVTGLDRATVGRYDRAPLVVLKELGRVTQLATRRWQIVYRSFIQALQGELGDSTESERTGDGVRVRVRGNSQPPSVSSRSLPNTAPSSETNVIAPYRLTSSTNIRDLHHRPRSGIYIFATQWCLFNSFAV